jgi:CO/xanthine dehydrogenase FAD-binding subunit
MKFEAYIPETLQDALGLIRKYGADARVIAGGTDLFILMKSRLAAPRHLIHIGGLEELKGVWEEGGVISLGAGLTHSEIAGLGLLEDIACLTGAAGSVGSPQVRNVGTAGGNLANASPAADLYPPLLALDAKLKILVDGDARTLELRRFVRGPAMTALGPEEIIGRIVFTKPKEPFFSAHSKVGLRNALAVSVTSAAIVARARDGKLSDVKIACGAVAPIPIRMEKVERLLEGEAPSEELIAEAGLKASGECDPITDIRATREYRCQVTGVIVSRLVRAACRHLLDYKDGLDGRPR